MIALRRETPAVVAGKTLNKGGLYDPQTQQATVPSEAHNENERGVLNHPLLLSQYKPYRGADLNV